MSIIVLDRVLVSQLCSFHWSTITGEFVILRVLSSCNFSFVRVDELLWELFLALEASAVRVLAHTNWVEESFALRALFSLIFNVQDFLTHADWFQLGHQLGLLVFSSVISQVELANEPLAEEVKF
jgi:hypothetical protein